MVAQWFGGSVVWWFGGSLLLQPAKMSLKSLGSFTVLAALISLWL